MILRIAIGADHRGYELKKFIIANLVTSFTSNSALKTNELTEIAPEEIIWLDQGCDNNLACDYPEFTNKVCQQILTNQAELGILICGSGIGMSIAANRCPKIYAGLAWDPEIARSAKADNNCNVLVLPADFLTPELTLEIIKTWLNTKFKAGKYQARLNNLDQ
jgi:ribose 5-phosphate isomerase B